MKSVLNCTAFVKIRIVVFVLFFSCFVSTFLLKFNNVVRAVDAKPTCSAGGVYGGVGQSTFTIKLNCSDLSTFVNSESTTAIPADWVGIKLIQGETFYNPQDATISGDELSLVFDTNYGSRIRDIEFQSGVLVGDSGATNDGFSILTADILDCASPLLADDFYSANSGSDLSVSAEEGILLNDIDGESIVINATVSIGPTKGSLDLSPDGSFAYKPFSEYDGSDFFEYKATDEAGNPSTAIVYLNDESPVILSPYSYRDNPDEDPNYVKVGDVVRVDFATNEPVVVDSVMISGHPAILESTDSMYFTFYYTMQEGDKEGVVQYSINVRDLMNKQGSYSNEDGVYFDKTKPIINLNGDDYIELVLNGDYFETVFATDDHDDGATVYSDISVDTSQIGTYVITYTAADSAGNQADPVMRTVVIIDSISKDFKDISNDLRLFGLENNLDIVGSDDYTNFSGLYIESSSAGVRFGRITFNNEIDLSNPDVLIFLNELIDRMDSSKVGEIGFNISGMTDLLEYFGSNITLEFFNLDQLGFNKDSTLLDIFSKLEVYDDEGSIIEDLDLDMNHAAYSGCSQGQLNCYSFTLNVDHFSKYIINKIIYPKKDKTIDATSTLVATINLGQGGSGVGVNSNGNGSTEYYSNGSSDTLGVRVEGKEESLIESKKEDSNVKKQIAQMKTVLAWQWWLMIVLVVILAVWAVYMILFHQNDN